jgi:hypothetical protein
MDDPTLEEVAAFVREWAQLSAKKRASPETEFARDQPAARKEEYLWLKGNRH